MKTIAERYYHIVGKPKAEELGLGSTEENYIRADVYYDEGGYGYLSGKISKRGYSISAHTIGRGKDAHGYWESTNIFGCKGAKQFLFDVKRQSKKKESEAVAYFNENIDEFVRKTFEGMEVELCEH